MLSWPTFFPAGSPNLMVAVALGERPYYTDKFFQAPPHLSFIIEKKELSAQKSANSPTEQVF
jgi:hypothetical protein